MKNIRNHRTLYVVLTFIIGISLGLLMFGQPGLTSRLAAQADSSQEEIAVDDSGLVEYGDVFEAVDDDVEKVAGVAQTTELSVDDGSFETSLGLNNPGTIYFVNRLRPSGYPATLNQLRIFWRSATGISANLPVTLLVGANADGDENINGTSFQMTNATIQSVGSFNTYSVPNITINSGDFVVGFRVQFNTATFAGATDTSQTSNRRSYFSTDANGASFMLTETIPNIGGGNLGIRAVVTVQQQPGSAVDGLVASYIDPNRGDNGTGDLTGILNVATTATIGGSIATQGNNAEVVIAPNGQYAVAYPTGAGDSVTIINNLSSSPAQGQTIQTGNTPNAVVITPDSSTAVVFNALSSPVTYRIIQGLPNSPAVSGTFSITGANNTVAEDAAISPSGATVLVSLFNTNQVAIISGFPGAPSLRGTIDTDQGPNGIAFTPDGNTAFVANTLGNSIEVISGLLPNNTPFGANRVFNGVGPNPQAIALTPDGTRALVTNTGGNTVSVFQVNGTNLNFLQNLNVGQSPAGLAISSNGQVALVANAASNTISVIRGLNTSPFVAETLGPSQSLDTASFAERSVALAPGGAPPPPPQAPDFVVENLSINPTSALPGSNVTVNFTIRNQGNATAGSATHNIVLSSDNNIGGGDPVLLGVATPSLAAGAAQAFSQTVTIPNNAAAGQQFVGVNADAAGQVAESNEGNNTASTPITIQGAQADLVVQNLSINPTSALPGSNVTVSFTIRNQGNASAASTSHNIVLSLDNNIDGSDQVLLSVATPVLNAGAQQAFSQTVTIPNNASAGQQFIGVAADAAGQVAESSEGNNTASTPITILGLQPDLIAQNLSVNPTSTSPNSSVNVSFTIRNQGNGNAGSSIFRIVLSPDNIIGNGNDQELLSGGTPSLTAGAQQAFSVNVTIPNNASGQQFIGVIADATGIVTESNEGNNTAATAITIQSLQADLVVENLSINPTSALPGSNVTVSFTIRNQGNASAASTSHNIVLSLDNNIDGGDQVLLSVATPVLNAGASQPFSQIVTIPNNASAGSRFIGVIADAAGQVAESNEGNNTASTPITILGLQPDLIAQNLSVNPTSTSPNSSVNVSFTIRNQGNGNAGSSIFRIVLSPDNIIGNGNDQELLSGGTPSLTAGAQQAFSVNVTIPNNASGQQFIGVIADATGIVTESNEGNNTATTAITIATLQADLVVENLSVNPTTVFPGGNLTVSFTIRNQGNASAASTSHNIVLSLDNNITGGDQVLLSVATPVLNAGASQPFSQVVTIPNNASAGQQFIGVIVDAAGIVSESTEANNTASTPISIGIFQPDFVVLNLGVSPSSTTPGSNVTVSFTIQNQGGGTAAAATHSVYLSGDANITTGDLLLTSVATGVLGTSATQSFSPVVTIPANTSSGQFFIGVFADSPNAVTESNEGNNTASTLITILGVQADLVVQNLSVNPTTTTAGSTVTVNFTIRNQGNASAASTSHNIVLSSDNNIGGGDPVLLSVATPVLNAGGQQAFSQVVTIPNNTSAGQMFIGIVADAAGQVAESNEGNNTASTPITIQAANTDPNEPNDSPQQTTLLTLPGLGQSFSISGNAVPDDSGFTATQFNNECMKAGLVLHDWFRLPLGQRSAIGASLSIQSNDADFDLFLFQQTGDLVHFPQGIQLIARADASVPGQTETIATRVLEPATYFFVVARVRRNNATDFNRVGYTLTLTRGSSPELHQIEDVSCTLQLINATGNPFVVNRVRPTSFPARLEAITAIFAPHANAPNPNGRQVRFIAFLDPDGDGVPPVNPALVVNTMGTITIQGGAATFNTLNLGANGPLINSGDIYVGYVADPANGIFPDAGRALDPNVRTYLSSNGGVSYQVSNIVDNTGQVFNVAIRSTINTRPFGKTSSADSSDAWFTYEIVPGLLPRPVIIDLR